MCAAMLRAFTVFLLLAFGGALFAAEPSGDRFARVTVAPTKTSIYVGTVSMAMPPFLRNGDRFESTYSAKVFPYFFYNESGSLRIEFTDPMLQALARGEPVEFKGRALRHDGAERGVEGKATPESPTSGKIKVRVAYSKRVELIFNTTYQFSGDERPEAAASKR
jgi:hypothetical protein